MNVETASSCAFDSANYVSCSAGDGMNAELESGPAYLSSCASASTGWGDIYGDDVVVASETTDSVYAVP